MGWDRISELPDHLLAHILSYLGIYDSVKTSVLSKRWEFFWLNVSVLDVNVINFLPYGEALANLMRRFFEFNHGRSCLQKFKIKLASNDNLFDYRKRVMEWIAEFVHRGVEHLDVETDKSLIKYQHGRRRTPSRAIDFMPKYMYVSKTLVSLKLVNVGLEDTKFDVSLPCLKIMHLEKIHYRSNGFFIIGRFISASPVLKDLTLEFPFSNKKEEIDFSPNGSVSMQSGQDGFLCFFPHSEKPKEVVFPDVPRCLSLTLECVTINKLNMKEKTGIKLVKYFLENSAVLKKMTLILTHASIRNQEPETYTELLTYAKLSLECQVFIY